MEDMARLALVEQNVRDVETFSQILYELLRHIKHILENPHDYELRTIRSEALKNYLRYEAFVDYLKSIGFKSVENEFTYPKEHTLSNLRMAQAAIERKIYFCCGSLSHSALSAKSVPKVPVAKQPKLVPQKMLNTSNPILLKLEALFNDVLQFEDEELQALAREHIPIVTLQLMALDELRAHQKKIKTGETKERDMPFDIALLRVLMGWFKHRFFTWVDTPPCEDCGRDTVFDSVSTLTTDTETCRLELYKCESCGGSASFPRHTNARRLLETRRGRCGEWAACFTLLARSLGYDTRLVLCTSDHVWCEIFDYDSNKWLHADPCECILDAPLVYSHGWNKNLTYVFACSRDDLQDVTWRYTTDFKQVLSRRREVKESDLINSILLMREIRQRGLSAARRRYLARRNLQELAQMLTERKVSESELAGRISGSAAWRKARAESGCPRHVFRFNTPGVCRITYSAATDRYEIEGADEKEIVGFAAGAYSVQSVSRTVEKDWKMAYLARDEEAECGVISWSLEAGPGLQFTALAVRAPLARFHSGRGAWTIQLDHGTPRPAAFSETTTEISARFRRCVLRCVLSGGDGPTAWQHAQLYREPLRAHPPPTQKHLSIVATLVEDNTTS